MLQPFCTLVLPRLNCRYDRFFSAFPDLEGAFGSLGSFFGATFPEEGSFEANPPFVPEMMTLMATKLETLLSDNKALREALKDVRARVFKTDIDGDPWIIQSKIDKALAASEKEGK